MGNTGRCKFYNTYSSALIAGRELLLFWWVHHSQPLQAHHKGKPITYPPDKRNVLVGAVRANRKENKTMVYIKEKLRHIVSTSSVEGEDVEYEIPVGYIPSKKEIMICTEEEVEKATKLYPDIEFASLECYVTVYWRSIADYIVDCLYEQALNFKRICNGEPIR